MGFQELAIRAPRFLKENRDWARAKHLQYEAFSRSRPQLEPRMHELCASYRPVVTQADLDAAHHDYPEPTAALLQAEMSRISEHLEPITEGWLL